MRFVIATAVVLMSILSAFDARAITVRIDAAPGSLEDPGVAYWVTQGPSVGVTFVLSEPAPPGGLDILVLSDMAPPQAYVHFDEGQTQAYAVRTFPANHPFYTLDDCWTVRGGYLAILGASGVETGDPRTLVVWEARVENTYCDCSSCWTAYFMCLITFGSDCLDLLPPICAAGGRPAPAADHVGLPFDPPATPRGGSLAEAWYPAIEVLARYRDEILAATPEGQFYTDLYEQHSFDIELAIASSPFLIIELTFAKEAWIAGLDALVNGTGAQFVVTQEMQDDLLSILQKLEDVGSPALAEMIAFERERLALDSIAGLKMTQFQQRVENQGPVSVEPSSWGRVKGLYR